MTQQEIREAAFKRHPDTHVITIVNRYEGNGRRETSFDIVWFSYNPITYSCDKHTARVGRTQLIEAVRSNKAFLINATLSKDNKVIGKVFLEPKDRVLSIVNAVRSAMEAYHGTETDLSGFCIDASETLCSNLLIHGFKDAKVVEGWCIYEDPSNCTDKPYGEHTWVEIEKHGRDNIYIDVTADQFNYFGNEYNKVIIQRGLPDNMVYDEPTYLMDEDW